jgi:hypothetical protein
VLVRTIKPAFPATLVWNVAASAVERGGNQAGKEVSR